MTFPLWGYVAAGSLAVGFGAGWQINEWRHDAKELKTVRKADKKAGTQRAKVHEESKSYEQDREQARQAGAQREERIRTIYRDVPAPPALCEPPADVRGVLDDAIKSANARVGSQSGAGLPATAVPAKPASGPR